MRRLQKDKTRAWFGTKSKIPSTFKNNARYRFRKLEEILGWKSNSVGCSSLTKMLSKYLIYEQKPNLSQFLLISLFELQEIQD